MSMNSQNVTVDGHNGTRYWDTFQYFDASFNVFIIPNEGLIQPYIPTTCFRHHERSNVLWCDGHVKSMPAVYPLVPDANGNSPAALKGAHIGSILKGPLTGVAAKDDCYYELTKPAN